MARHKLGTNSDEIIEIRSRLFLERWDTMPADILRRQFAVESLIGSALGDELHRHVVMSSIAALQTFHRGTIVRIIDHGDVYRRRAAELLTDKISMKDALSWIEGKTFTFGELVAHGMPCNSVTCLLSVLEELLDCDIKKMLSEVVSKWDQRNSTVAPPLVVSDVDDLLSNLGEAFRLRHIFAHEAAPDVVVDAEKCRNLHAAVSQWVDAIDAILWATIYKDVPLTTYGMNMNAKEKINEARLGLARVMRIALNDARAKGDASWLRTNHFAWKKVTYGWFASSFWSLDGTMWSAVGGLDLARAIDARTSLIASWVKWTVPEEALGDLGLDEVADL